MAALVLAAPGTFVALPAAADEPNGMRRERIKTLDDAGAKIVPLAEATPETG